MRFVRSIVAFATLAALAIAAAPAEARLPEAFSKLSKEIVRKAVHMPTGCLAQVVMDDTQLVKANIVDPDCLPKGIEARPVPGESRDFTIIEGIR